MLAKQRHVCPRRNGTCVAERANWPPCCLVFINPRPSCAQDGAHWPQRTAMCERAPRQAHRAKAPYTSERASARNWGDPKLYPTRRSHNAKSMGALYCTPRRGCFAKSGTRDTLLQCYQSNNLFQLCRGIAWPSCGNVSCSRAMCLETPWAGTSGASVCELQFAAI